MHFVPFILLNIFVGFLCAMSMNSAVERKAYGWAALHGALSLLNFAFAVINTVAAAS